MIGRESAHTRPLRLRLESAGYTVKWIASSITFLTSFPDTPYGACLIDLPETPGSTNTALIRLYRRCKAFFMPTLLMGNSATHVRFLPAPWFDRNDFVLKPISSNAALARLQTSIETVYQNNQNTASQWHQLRVDHHNRRVYLNENPVHLTRYETLLALHFLRNLGQVVTREYLISHVWAESSDLDTRKIDVHICALRRKLKLLPSYGWKLTAIYGVGYRLIQLRTAEFSN